MFVWETLKIKFQRCGQKHFHGNILAGNQCIKKRRRLLDQTNTGQAKQRN